MPTRTRSWRHPWEDLQPIDYFAGLPLSVLRDAAKGADRVDIPPGERLVRAGSHLRWVWVVVAGVLEVRPGGHLVLPGAAFGEAEVVLGEPSKFDVVAASPATVLSLSAQVFHGLLGNPDFAAGVARRLAREALARPDEPWTVPVASGR